jgi:toxin ParE1/3/4
MSLPLLFRPAAQDEFAEAASWYEARREGLGSEFVAEVQNVLDAIADDPERYASVVADVREAIVSRFPYCVYYRKRSKRIVIIAVFHSSRDPAIWQSRL